MSTISSPLTAAQIADLFDETVARLSPRPSGVNLAPLPIDTLMKDRIEHTVLRSDCTEADIEQLCADALTHRFRGVCVNPRDVARCAARLDGSDVLVISVVDFPLGCGGADAAGSQAARVVALGAAEVDMVIDVRAVKAGAWKETASGIAAVVAAASPAPVKVILETGLLSESEIVKACAISFCVGAAYVKTSTGFGPRGASVRDVEIMRTAVQNRMRIKAAGGIRDHRFAAELIAAGADVIGTSNGPACL